ncbi:uncharacterized protein LOC130654621 isoform X2 [Hydractinia symbiolongicarpus]|uniref:uncharacterized protein LOC130654621 isoform X2 n=1 Tax=Hydractinia symbiolongicarpus TaxID=13093 RepID=UPI00254C2A20|nr:uncharacterized protein LOC130654621 isoform X2 [Hydractinia symbiolongicarpus]
MPSSRRKPVDEARNRLNEKLTDIRNKTQQLHDVINNISKDAIVNAERVLKESSKSKFLHKYAKVSQELESCLNHLLLLSDAAASIEEESDNEDESGNDDKETDKDLDSESCVSAALSVSTVHETEPCKSKESTIIEGSPLIQRQESQESLFSSVSMTTTPENSTPFEYPILSKDVIVQSFKWESDFVYPVLVTNFQSPWEFYVQLVDSENDIMEQLCMKFMKEATKGYKGGIGEIPSVGLFCCAKSPVDEAWYRAKIVEVLHDLSTRNTSNFIKVHFIDEGYDTFVSLSAIRPLEKKYSNLPSQSVKCILGGLQPLSALGETKSLSFSECNKMWLAETNNWFKHIISTNSIFAAYFYYPPKASYDPPHNLSKDVLVCDLYIHNADANLKWRNLSYNRPPIELHVGFKMILNFLAAYCPFFNSELTRKKSQRALQLARDEKENKFVSEKEPLELAKVANAPIIKKEPMSPLQQAVSSNGPDVRMKTANKTTVKTKGLLFKDTQKKEERPCKKETALLEERPPKEEKSPKKERPPRGKTSPRDKSLPKEKRLLKKERSPREKTPPKEKEKPPGVSPKNGEKLFREETSLRNLPVKSENYSSGEVKTKTNEVKCLHSENQATGSDTRDNYDANTKFTDPINQKKDDAIKKTYDFGVSFQETEFVINDPEGFAKILISEVVDPGLFYIHLIQPEVVLLDKMMNELNMFYDKKEASLREACSDVTYSVGMCVVARFSVDNRWYRGIIVSTNPDKHIEYNVLHVDFGSSEWVTVEKLLPVYKVFCELPMETIPCCLADVEPLLVTTQQPIVRAAGDESEDDMLLDDVKPLHSKWSERSIGKLKILAQNQLPLMASLKTECKNSDGLYEIYLYDTMFDKDEFINQALVDEGLVYSKEFDKTVPSVRLSELELENEATEIDALSQWDPMKEQYLSKRNAYSVNIDDPSVAMLGYVDNRKERCFTFFRRGYCYRGEDCRYLHVDPNDPVANRVEVYCDDSVTELPEIGDWVPITVTALFDPTHFWVNFPYGLSVFSLGASARTRHNTDDDNDLERLVDKMNDHYSRTSKDHTTDLTILAEGELVAARYQDDNRWYRARVISTAEDLTQVFYIDYGNTDVVSEENVRKLLPDFLHLPQQAVECFLNATEFEPLVKEDQLKYDNLRNKFRDLTADKVLVAHVINRTISKSMLIELYDTSIEPNAHINSIVRDWDGIIHKKETKHEYNQTGKIVKKNLMQYIPG